MDIIETWKEHHDNKKLESHLKMGLTSHLKLYFFHTKRNPSNETKNWPLMSPFWSPPDFRLWSQQMESQGKFLGDQGWVGKSVFVRGLRVCVFCFPSFYINLKSIFVALYMTFLERCFFLRGFCFIFTVKAGDPRGKTLWWSSRWKNNSQKGGDLVFWVPR